MGNIQSILAAIFTGVPVLILVIAIARYNIYNKHNVLLHVFGILTILAGSVMTGEKICQIISPEGFLGYSGGMLCFASFITLLLAYAIAVNVFMEIQLKDDNRPAILGTSILAFAGFVFYAVNSILNVIGYGIVVEYCVYIVVMLCAFGISGERKKLKRYCRKNSIEYDVLTSRKKDDIDYNVYWVNVEKAIQERRDLVFSKAAYNRLKDDLPEGEIKLDDLEEKLEDLYKGLSKRDLKKMSKDDKKEQKLEEKQEKRNKKEEKKHKKESAKNIEDGVILPPIQSDLTGVNETKEHGSEPTESDTPTSEVVESAIVKVENAESEAATENEDSVTNSENNEASGEDNGEKTAMANEVSEPTIKSEETENKEGVNKETDKNSALIEEENDLFRGVEFVEIGEDNVTVAESEVNNAKV